MNSPLKNKDLRVGNYIMSGNNGKFQEGGSIGRVLEIGNEDREFEQIYCECSESFDWFFRDNYFGVPIKPNVLEKMGFKPDKDGFSWYCMEYEAFEDPDDELREMYLRHTVKIWINTESLECCITNTTEDEFGASTKQKIEYVHKLQNLIFSLTGEDIEFDLLDLTEEK
jgi:hypothetical protein